MNEKNQKICEQLLDQTALRTNLIVASIYIAAFELLKESIIERIREFYSFRFQKGKIQTDPEYATEVLTKSRSPLYASLQWLKEIDAIDSSDIAMFEQAKKCRNILAHEMFEISTKGLPLEWKKCFEEMVYLLGKIEKWWIINVEIPINPDFDSKIVGENQIIPGPILSLKLMYHIALGQNDS